MGIAIDDVYDNDADVVVTTIAIGDPNQFVGSRLRVVVGTEHLGNLVVHDFIDKAVAAQEETFTRNRRDIPHVDADIRLDTEGACDDVSVRMRTRLRPGDLSGIDQFTDVTVVLTDLSERAVSHRVDPGVTDVHDGDAVADNRQRADGCAHAAQQRFGQRPVEDGSVGCTNGGHQTFARWLAVGTQLQEMVGRQSAGDFSGGMAAHAISHREHRELGDDGVFVQTSGATNIGERAPTQCHHVSSPPSPRSQPAIGRQPASGLVRLSADR